MHGCVLFPFIMHLITDRLGHPLLKALFVTMEISIMPEIIICHITSTGVWRWRLDKGWGGLRCPKLIKSAFVSSRTC
eukprot:1572492-Karenia_brevis.AAC.1